MPSIGMISRKIRRFWTHMYVVRVNLGKGSVPLNLIFEHYLTNKHISQYFEAFFLLLYMNNTFLNKSEYCLSKLEVFQVKERHATLKICNFEKYFITNLT